jgi:hypothetical protein
MPTSTEKSQAKTFISEIFDIVAKSLKTAISNKPNLLKNAGLAIEQNSVDSLFEQLASEIQGDSDTVDMIHDNRNNYQERINNALNTKCIEGEEKDFVEGSIFSSSGQI